MKTEEPTPVYGREFIMDLVEIVLGEESLRLGVSWRSILIPHTWSTRQFYLLVHLSLGDGLRLFLVLECLEFDLLVYMGFHPWCLGVVNALIWGGKGDYT